MTSMPDKRPCLSDSHWLTQNSDMDSTLHLFDPAVSGIPNSRKARVQDLLILDVTQDIQSKTPEASKAPIATQTETRMKNTTRSSYTRKEP